MQILNGHAVNKNRQNKMHTGGLFVSKPSFADGEIAIENLEKYKSPGDQMSAEIIKATSTTLSSKIHKLIHSVWNKEELSQQWNITMKAHCALVEIN
jgi:hypothetical protein